MECSEGQQKVAEPTGSSSTDDANIVVRQTLILNEEEVNEKQCYEHRDTKAIADDSLSKIIYKKNVSSIESNC